MCSHWIISDDNGSFSSSSNEETVKCTDLHMKTLQPASFSQSGYFYSQVCGIINNILSLPFWPFSGKDWQAKNWIGLEIGCNSVSPGQLDDLPYTGFLFASLSFFSCSCQTHGAISNIHLGCAIDDSQHLLSRAVSK